MIISICDFYDAAMQYKNSQGGCSRDESYNLMTKEKEGWFHPQLLEKFFKIMED
jgi:HD-GYP domain-containing protein (c-di-GMP phosphodiesterase class II)